MPKKETKGKWTTARKPLKDVSNGNFLSSKTLKKKKKAERVEEEGGEEALLDRLLLVHSHLSSLINQIDELVVQALEVKSKKGRKEIESFTQVLSEIQSSLEPWAPTFQKALFNGSENEVGQSLVSRTVPLVNEDASDAVQSPEHTKFDSRVSPSPLVSWRADWTVEGGRQLFLLTPLPRPKAISSKLQGASKSAIEKITFNTTGKLPSLTAISGDTNDDLLEGVAVKPTPSKVSDINLETGVVSSPKSLKKDCSLLCMTPCLKMSPPKSCVLLEPISEIAHKDNHGVRKSTPFPVGIQDFSSSQSSESSSCEVSENLALKYPELFGIRHHEKLGNGRKGVEASPDWLMSPPKTCVLMEPPDEKSLAHATSKYQVPRTAGAQNQQICFSIVKGNDFQSGHHLSRNFCIREHGITLAIIESTPMLKEPGSTFQTGKRPGENTLKKELWTRFEAASTHGIRVNVSVHQETAKKGFLDRLEEVSCDDDKSSA